MSTSSRPCAGWAMSAARNAETKRVTSIARAINWNCMWRRLVSYVWLDRLLLLVCGGDPRLWIQPDATRRRVYRRMDSRRHRSRHVADASTRLGSTTLTYTVELAYHQDLPLAQDPVKLWPLYLVVVGWQVISVLNMLGGAADCAAMAPLNDRPCAWTNSAACSSPAARWKRWSRPSRRASVDSPSVTTGDADLASIEVALNRLLRQMQEAKLQQMRFVNDANHELRTPIAVIQGYVNMLDRWGKDDPDVLAESIASLKAESEHMQELVEQLLFLARGDAGRTVLRRADTNLAALVDEVCEESQMSIPSTRIGWPLTLHLSSDPRCDASVDVALVKQTLRDRAKRRQVFGRGNDRHIWHNTRCGHGHGRHSR